MFLPVFHHFQANVSYIAHHVKCVIKYYSTNQTKNQMNGLDRRHIDNNRLGLLTL